MSFERKIAAELIFMTLVYNSRFSFPGLILISLAFVLCVQLSSSPSKGPRSGRLVQKSQNFFYAEKAEGSLHQQSEGNPDDPDVFDSQNRGIRFVSGELNQREGRDNSVNKKKKKSKYSFQEDEIEYYKRKNKLLYAAKAEEVKVR